MKTFIKKGNKVILKIGDHFKVCRCERANGKLNCTGCALIGEGIEACANMACKIEDRYDQSAVIFKPLNT